MEKFSIKENDFIDIKAYFKNTLVFHTFGNFRNLKDIKETVFSSLPYELTYKKIGFEIENKTNKKVTYFNAFDN